MNVNRMGSMNVGAVSRSCTDSRLLPPLCDCQWRSSGMTCTLWRGSDLGHMTRYAGHLAPTCAKGAMRRRATSTCPKPICRFKVLTRTLPASIRSASPGLETSRSRCRSNGATRKMLRILVRAASSSGIRVVACMVQASCLLALTPTVYPPTSPLWVPQGWQNPGGGRPRGSD